MKHKSFTLIELMICVGIITLLLGVVMVLINPRELLAKARDEKLLSKVTEFDAYILEHKIDNGVYPDLTPPPGIIYMHTPSSYEINVVLEFLVEQAQNDGGNDPGVYETGNDLTLI